MKVQVMCVLDLSAGVYQRPIFVPAVGVGIRMFTDEVNRDAVDNVMFHHPADFELYHLGEYDDAVPCFELTEKKRVSRGIDVHLNGER